MNEREFLRIGPLNDEQIGMHSFIKNRINPHCVLILIGYRIDLLLFFFSSEPNSSLITNGIEQILILSPKESTEKGRYSNAIKLHSVYFSLIKGYFHGFALVSCSYCRIE